MVAKFPFDASIQHDYTTAFSREKEDNLEHTHKISGLIFLWTPFEFHERTKKQINKIIIGFPIIDNRFDRYRYVRHLRLGFDHDRRVQWQKNWYSVGIQQWHVVLNDGCFFDRGNNHRHDHDQRYRLERFHRMSREDRERLCNSKEDQEDHKHWDEWGYDL